jgi:hypothetical protein
MTLFRWDGLTALAKFEWYTTLWCSNRGLEPSIADDTHSSMTAAACSPPRNASRTESTDALELFPRCVHTTQLARRWSSSSRPSVSEQALGMAAPPGCMASPHLRDCRRSERSAAASNEMSVGTNTLPVRPGMFRESAKVHPCGLTPCLRSVLVLGIVQFIKTACRRCFWRSVICQHPHVGYCNSYD